jgi:hypothetical protein
MAEQRALTLYLEMGKGPRFWGTCTVDGNLIVHSAKSFSKLRDEMAEIILDCNDIEVTEFTILGVEEEEVGNG